MPYSHLALVPLLTPTPENTVNDVSMYRCIGNSISRRAALVAELTAKQEHQNRLDAEVRAHLLKLAPKGLRDWLNEEVLTGLFVWGRCYSKINFGDHYGFKDTQDVRAKMKALGKAWKDAVSIKLLTPEDDRIEVRLAALL